MSCDFFFQYVSIFIALEKLNKLFPTDDRDINAVITDVIYID